jgi:5-methylcytosine-specific restriction enzyme A
LKRPVTLKPACQRSKAERNAAYEATRGTSVERGYGSRWQKARLIHLAGEPLCRLCSAEGRIEQATVVDHVIPHRGDMQLFWDETNWQSLCEFHHDRDKHSQEVLAAKKPDAGLSF